MYVHFQVNLSLSLSLSACCDILWVIPVILKWFSMCKALPLYTKKQKDPSSGEGEGETKEQEEDSEEEEECGACQSLVMDNFQNWTSRSSLDVRWD